MRRKRRNLRNNRLTKPSNSIDSGNISQPADEVMAEPGAEPMAAPAEPTPVEAGV